MTYTIWTHSFRSGLKGFKSLSNAATENGGALSFTGGDAVSPPSDKKEGNENQEGNGPLYPESQNFNEFPNGHSEMSSSLSFESIYGKPHQQEYHHNSNGVHENNQEEESHVVNLGPPSLGDHAGE